MEDQKTKTKITWKLREGSDADAFGILECRRITFPKEDLEKQDIKYWKWEFDDNFAGSARIFIAVDGSNVVGHYAVIPQFYWLNNRRYNGSIVVDVMTDPKYHFQGMFTALGRYALNNCVEHTTLEFTTGYPIRPEVLPGHLKVGWKVRFKIGIWIMPLGLSGICDSDSQIYQRFLKVLGIVPKTIFRMYSSFLLRDKKEYKVLTYEKCEITQFDQFWNDFLKSAPKDCIFQERSLEYLKWRYDLNPGRDYTYHVAIGNDGKMEGFVVTRVISLFSTKIMIIVDACVLPKHSLNVFKHLIKKVRQSALSNRCALCAMMVTQPNPLFPRPWIYGFIPIPFKKFTFITYNFKNVSDINSELLSWHLMWGDTDDV